MPGRTFVHDLLTEWRKHVHAIAPFNLRPVLRGPVVPGGRRDFELDYHLRHVALSNPGASANCWPWCHASTHLLDRNRRCGKSMLSKAPGGRFCHLQQNASRADRRCHWRTHGSQLHVSRCAVASSQHCPSANTTPGAARPPPAGLLQQLTAMARMGRDSARRGQRPVGHRARQHGNRARCPALSGTANALQRGNCRFRRFAAQSYALSRIKRIGEAAGATVNDVTPGHFAPLALREYLQSQAACPRSR